MKQLLLMFFLSCILKSAISQQFTPCFQEVVRIAFNNDSIAKIVFNKSSRGSKSFIYFNEPASGSLCRKNEIVDSVQRVFSFTNRIITFGKGEVYLFAQPDILANKSDSIRTVVVTVSCTVRSEKILFRFYTTNLEPSRLARAFNKTQKFYSVSCFLTRKKSVWFLDKTVIEKREHKALVSD